MRVVDVLVVGGGPGGAAAAIELARAGNDVALIDKSVFPRDKCCGDGLTTSALRHLDQLGLDPSDVPSWQPVAGCWVRSPSGRTVEFPFPPGAGTFGAVARRTDLDAALLDVARSAGVAVHEGVRFDSIQANDDGLTVGTTTAGAMAARYVVAADGMWSPVRRAIEGPDQPAYLGEWHAFRGYVRSSGAEARKLWVWFEPALLPGYAWSFPLPDGVVNIGFGIPRRAGEPTGTMAAAWRDLLTQEHVAAVLGDGWAPEAAHKAWPIPARLPSTTLTALAGRVLFVGDAARAADPMTGEGIGQALETGRLAASVIREAGPARPDHAAARYRRTLQRGMAIDHRLATLLSDALRSSRGARGAVRIAGASPWTRRNFARWLFEDYPRAIVSTPHRWQRGMFHGDGAGFGRVTARGR